jgi:sarcosine oxidase subunit beta
VSLAWNDQHAAEWREMAAREREGGLNCVWLDRAETRNVVPAVRRPYQGSVYYPSDASAHPYRACVALARAAVRAGARIHERRAVTGIEVTHGKIVGVRTPSASIATQRLVVAAGGWSAELSGAIGVRIRAEARRSHLIVTEKLPPILGPVVATLYCCYLRQTPSGNMSIGYPARPVEGLDRRVTLDAVRTAARRAARLIPSLAQVSLVRAFTGFTVWTPDLRSVIGAANEPARLYVATAFCGRRFALGPAVGEALGELITTGRTPLSIAPYGLDRFGPASGQPTGGGDMPGFPEVGIWGSSKRCGCLSGVGLGTPGLMVREANYKEDAMQLARKPQWVTFDCYGTLIDTRIG